jgi:MFS transporter, DHA3 family, macrolide efflux protein
MQTFIIIICGQLVSNLGSRLTDFGLGVWIFQETHSATSFALSILISALPRIVLAPFIGALVDRWDRRKIMIISDTILAGRTLAVLLILLFGRLSIWQIYVMNAVGSVFESFHGLSWSASTTLLVPKKHLARVNGITQVFGSGTSMLAPALAGVLFVLVGMKGIAAIDLISWAFAVVPLLFVRIPAPAKRKVALESPTVLKEVAEGWKYIIKLKGMLFLLLAYSAIGFFGITTEVLRGPYVLYSHGPAEYGIIESVVSIGTLVGGLLLAIIGNPKNAIPIILFSEFLTCVFSILMGAIPAYWVLLVSVFLYYLAISYCDGTIVALWQRKIPPELQGRVFALKDTLTMSLMPLGILCFSPLAEFWMEPNLLPGGAWASNIGRIIGVGKGRGIGFLFIASGLISVIVVALAVANRKVRRIEAEIQDFAS